MQQQLTLFQPSTMKGTDAIWWQLPLAKQREAAIILAGLLIHHFQAIVHNKEVEVIVHNKEAAHDNK
jgi:hypothetical protein